MTDDAIRIDGVTKAFGRNQVLRGIDLVLPAGQVTVLMGANGAGKSTLVKILCGVHPADGGTVTLAGAPFTPASPQEALRSGVVTVHQNINDGVVPDLDVTSNLLLDDLAAGGSTFLRRRAMRDAARRMAEAVGLDIDLSRPVADVSIADRQLIAIARALSHSPRLLILDEPTSSLSVAETRRLFALIDRLRFGRGYPTGSARHPGPARKADPPSNRGGPDRPGEIQHLCRREGPHLPCPCATVRPCGGLA